MLSFLGDKVSLNLVEYEVMENDSYDQKCMHFKISSSSQGPESMRQLPKYRYVLSLQVS